MKWKKKTFLFSFTFKLLDEIEDSDWKQIKKGNQEILAYVLQSTAGWVKFKTSDACFSSCSQGESKWDADVTVHMVANFRITD